MPGWHYLEVEEDGEPSIVSYHQIVNRLFYVKTWEARRTITACVDSVVNFSGHEVSLGFLGNISFYPLVFILVDIFTLPRHTFLFLLIYLSS